MSIIKMKFVSIMGHKDYFEDFVLKYIIDSGIQLENALSFLENLKDLSYYSDENPYTDLLKSVSSLVSLMGLEKEIGESREAAANTITSAAEIRKDILWLEEKMHEYISENERIKELLNKYAHMQKQLELLINIDVDIDRFFNFDFIKFRFGRMPKKSYKQLQIYIDRLDVIAIPVSQDEDYIWMIYFTPKVYGEKIDGIFSSLYFERVRISEEVRGTPKEALLQLKENISRLTNDLKESENKLKNFIESNKERVISLYYAAIRLNRISEVRKYAAHTLESFYIIGWMPEDELKTLASALSNDNRVMLIQGEPDVVKTMKPPTELKNNKFFKPFEALVRLYGLPSYNEIDPTAFVAITYFIMFGLMFGDVGQGAVLLAAGILLMRLKVALGGVIAGAGLSSIIFGFLYGSIFGFEDWIPHLWIKPMEDINTMLVVGIATGAVFISVAMLLNIINGIKNRELARIWLDKNGIAGFIFYWGIVLSAVYLFRAQKLPIPAWLVILILGILILAMFFKEPVENLLHRKKFLPAAKGIFFLQTFFEMFDTVLSFFSNTISFIRLSAFALNHAGLFIAVLILAEMANGFSSVVEIIIGNIAIIGLEGLIVGIQALRLEYYELFSRFFSGDGRPYRPIRNQYFT